MTTKRVTGHQFKGKQRNYRPVIKEDIRQLAKQFYQETYSASHLFNPYLSEEEEFPIITEKVSNPVRIKLLEEYPVDRPWPAAEKHILQKKFLSCTKKTKRWQFEEQEGDLTWRTPLPN